MSGSQVGNSDDSSNVVAGASGASGASGAPGNGKAKLASAKAKKSNDAAFTLGADKDVAFFSTQVTYNMCLEQLELGGIVSEMNCEVPTMILYGSSVQFPAPLPSAVGSVNVIPNGAATDAFYKTHGYFVDGKYQGRVGQTPITCFSKVDPDIQLGARVRRMFRENGVVQLVQGMTLAEMQYAVLDHINFFNRSDILECLKVLKSALIDPDALEASLPAREDSRSSATAAVGSGGDMAGQPTCVTGDTAAEGCDEPTCVTGDMDSEGCDDEPTCVAVRTAALRQRVDGTCAADRQKRLDTENPKGLNGADPLLASCATVFGHSNLTYPLLETIAATMSTSCFNAISRAFESGFVDRFMLHYVARRLTLAQSNALNAAHVSLEYCLTNDTPAMVSLRNTSGLNVLVNEFNQKRVQIQTRMTGLAGAPGTMAYGYNVAKSSEQLANEPLDGVDQDSVLHITRLSVLKSLPPLVSVDPTFNVKDRALCFEKRSLQAFLRSSVPIPDVKGRVKGCWNSSAYDFFDVSYMRTLDDKSRNIDHSTRWEECIRVLNVSFGPGVFQAVCDSLPGLTNQQCVERCSRFTVVGNMVHVTLTVNNSAANPVVDVPKGQTFFGLGDLLANRQIAPSDALDQFAAMSGYSTNGLYRCYGPCSQLKSEIMSRVQVNHITVAEWNNFQSLVSAFVQDRIAHYCDPGGRRCIQMTTSDLDNFLADVFAARKEYFEAVERAKADGKAPGEIRMGGAVGPIPSATITGFNASLVATKNSRVPLQVTGSPSVAGDICLKVVLAPASNGKFYRQVTVTCDGHGFKAGDILFAVDGRRVKKDTDVALLLSQNRVMAVDVIRKVPQVGDLIGLGVLFGLGIFILLK